MLKNGRKRLNHWLKSWMYLSPPSGWENRQVLMHMFVLFHENGSWTRQNFSRNLKNLFTRPLELDFAFSANRADDGKRRHTWRLNRNMSKHLSAVSDPILHFHLFPGCFGQNVAEISSRSVWNDKKMRISALRQENIYIVRFWKMLTKVFDLSLQPAYTATFWPLSCSATWFICSMLVNGNTRKTHLVFGHKVR